MTISLPALREKRLETGTYQKLRASDECVSLPKECGSEFLFGSGLPMRSVFRSSIDTTNRTQQGKVANVESQGARHPFRTWSRRVKGLGGKTLEGM